MSFILCACNICQQNIEVDSDYLGETIDCPHCNGRTELRPTPPPAGVAEFRPQFQQAAPQKPRTFTQRYFAPILIVGAILAVLALAPILGPSLIIVGAIGLGAALYFLPSILAAANHKKNTASIVVLNVFLGWTLLGWVVALAWSVAKD